jgi:large subunit ribosomal protein L9
MKVLLIQDVEELGLAGEVKEVADGYGRNFLLPRGLAVLATKGALKRAELHRRRAAEKRQRLADEMTALANSVGQAKLVFQAKSGEKGRLYGSITSADIAEKLAEVVGHEIDRRKIMMDGTIKQLGSHQVTMRLSADIAADFEVIVEPLEPVELAEAEESAAVEEPVEEGEPAVEE